MPERVSSRRYRARVEYDGTDFAGFQVNPGKRTVQGVLEDALARLGNGAGGRVDGAGRTDAGVHATGQVIAFSYDGRLAATELGRALEALLPSDVAIRDLRRHRPGSTPAMRRGTGSTATPSGTGRAVRSASARRSGCGSRSTPPRWRGPGRSSSAGTTSAPSGRRTALRSGPCMAVRVRREGRLVTIDVRADAFLRGMVRRMVAALVEVGLGRWMKRASGRHSPTGDRPSTEPPPRRRGCASAASPSGDRHRTNDGEHEER